MSSDIFNCLWAVVAVILIFVGVPLIQEFWKQRENRYANETPEEKLPRQRKELRINAIGVWLLSSLMVYAFIANLFKSMGESQNLDLKNLVIIVVMFLWMVFTGYALWFQKKRTFWLFVFPILFLMVVVVINRKADLWLFFLLFIPLGIGVLYKSWNDYPQLR